MIISYILRQRPVLLTFFFLIILSPALAIAQADKIFKENSKAVVVVVTFNEKGEPISQGSGFIVRADGAVVTNYHVISNAKGIKVKAGGKVLDVEGLIYEDKENDLVILKVTGENLSIVKIGDIEKENIGEKVYVISSPRGLENTISDGLLSGIREITSDKKVLQITAPVSPGSSGGPVFNKDGEVIGIATFLLEEAQNLNFAMPVNVIKDMIENKKVTALQDSEIKDYKKTAEYWFSLGITYDDLGKYKEAIEAYKQAIRIKPEYDKAYYNLGIAYRDSGMFKEAIEAYKQVIRINPDFAEAYNNLGFAYDDLGKHKEAIEAYKEAIRIKPDYAEIHYNLGIAYGRSGMYEEEIESYKEAIRIKSDYADAYHNLGVAYGDSGMYKEEIDAYKEAIKIKPDFAEAYNILGVTYRKSGMYKEAFEAYKQAIKIKPDYAEAYNNLGIAYFKSEKYREAIEAYKQAIRINPDYDKAHYNLGNTYGMLDMYREAIEAYKQAIRSKPDDADAHNNLGITYNNLGITYEKSGKYKEAAEAFNQAIRIKPDYAEAHYNLGISSFILRDIGSALKEYKVLKDLDPEFASKLYKFIYK